MPYKAQNIRSMFSRLLRDQVQKAKWLEISWRSRIQKLGPTDQPTNQLTGAGSREANSSKKK